MATLGNLEETIDFEILKEEFDSYRLEDGSVLKLKMVLIKVKEAPTSPTGASGYSFNSTVVLGVIANKELMGPPSPSSPTPPNIVKDDLRFDRIDEEKWNEYRLANDVVLSIKQVIVKVSRTDRFDSMGCPIYIVNSQPIFKTSK